jgi:hypothetical protein
MKTQKMYNIYIYIYVCTCINTQDSPSTKAFATHARIYIHAHIYKYTYMLSQASNQPENALGGINSDFLNDNNKVKRDPLVLGGALGGGGVFGGGGAQKSHLGAEFGTAANKRAK